MDRREIAAILLLLFLALALRLYNIDRPLYGDEADWYKSALIVVDGSARWSNTLVSDSPPLGKAVFVATYAMTHIQNFRYVTLAFAMASLVVAYAMAREYFGRKSALLALLLLATSIYSIVGAQHVDRDGGMLAFLSMLMFYAYMKKENGARLSLGARGKAWLGISLASFIAAVLMRTNMVVLAFPIFALEYYRYEGAWKQKLGAALGKMAWFAIAFAISFAFWLALDSALGQQTMQNTFAHYLTYATGSNQGIGERLLRTAVSVARVAARLTVPMALALCIAAYAFWRERWKLEEKEKELLVVCGAWIFVGALTVLLVTQGNVPAYFAPFVPAIMLVVGHAAAKAEKVGVGFAALAVLLALVYLSLLSSLDFNEVNLLLMPVVGLAAVALVGIAWVVDKDANRLILALALMSIFASAFMLTDFRTYDAIRSQSVADAAAYFNSAGAGKIAESQERTLDLYASGQVVQYDNGKCVGVDGSMCSAAQSANFPAGYYVVDFPLRPPKLPQDIGAAFRFNLFDQKGVEKCELARTYVLHSVVVSEFYRC